MKIIQNFKNIIFVIIFLVANTSNLLAQKSNLVRYEVGFKVLNQIDYSRNFKSKHGRNIQIAIWYPSSVSQSSKKISYSDYLKLYLQEEGKVELSNKEVEDNIEEWIESFRKIEKEGSTFNWNSFIESELEVFNDTKLAEGEFPLLVYGAGSRGESFENSILFEYLASQGYIVASVPSIGINGHGMNIDPMGLETQARDMEFAIQKIFESKSFNIDRIATGGWSWGGLAAMLVQVRNEYVDAVISMDGSIATHINKIESFPYYSRSKLTTPYLFLSTQESTFERTELFFNSLKYSDSYHIAFNYIDHSDFTSYGYIARKNLGSSLNKIATYDAFKSYVLAFLNATLKEENTSKNFLTNNPIKNGYDSDLLSINSKKGFPKPPSESEFFAIIRDEGVEKGWDIYKEVKSNDGSYKIFEAYNLTVVAFQLVRDSVRSDESIRIMDMVLEEYPTSYSSYALKGRIHEIRGEIVEAYSNFNIAFGMALLDGQTSDQEKELVFYNDIMWYKGKMDSLKEKINN